MSLPPSEPEKKSSSSPEKPDHSHLADSSSAAASEPAALQRPVSIIPIAPLHWRLLAAVMDLVLLFIFSTLLLSKVLLPREYPAEYGRFEAAWTEYSSSLVESLKDKDSAPVAPPEVLMGEEALAISLYIVQITGLCILVYFVLCERFMAGGSLGKAMFRLRVISLNTGRPPTIWESLIRNVIKVAALSTWIFWVSFLLVFTNRLRRSGHDMLSRTLVVSDTGYVPHLVEPRRDNDDDDDGY